MGLFPIIVSAPSGGGKTSIVQSLLEADRGLLRVITATTRAPRAGEKNGRDYYFWSAAEFEKAIKKHEMAEWAKIHTHYYGIPKSSVENILKRNKCPVLVIDVQGAKTIKKIYPDAVSIFITPSSLKELKKRICARNDGTKNIELRLKTAQRELKEIKRYDYLVLNDIFEQAVLDCLIIIQAQRHNIKYLKDLKI